LSAAAACAPTCIQAEVARDLAERRLAAGDALRLVVSGGSMLPTLRPGDRLVIHPVSQGGEPDASAFPRPGALAVLRSPRGWTVHRLVGMHADDLQGLRLLTKGDARRSFDPPWQPADWVGVVSAVEMGGWSCDLTTPAATRRAALLAWVSSLEGRLNAAASPHRLRRALSRMAHRTLALLAGWSAGRRSGGQ
jgi:hypothetical protein